jgi:hypothetical protein
MFQLEVSRMIARERRESFEREAEMNRLLREAERQNEKPVRVPFASRALYAVGRWMVSAGSSLQQSYCETIGLGA